MNDVSNGFEKLMKETDGVGPALMQAVMTMSEKSTLDQKVHELAYISVLTAMRMQGGLPFHIKHAKQLGATKDEVKSAMLVPMPLIGIQVGDALAYLDVWDEEL